jgi:hypothetical protein
MKRNHRVHMPPASFEFDPGPTCPASCKSGTQKLADWCGKFFSSHARVLFANDFRIVDIFPS